MAKKMLVDAGHPEETRVVVVSGNRIEEFDFESAARKQLKGNIYLAKVTRVEPSLQAAFVEYGGNRHGFLAFSEIHPDYYKIPMADRERLIRQEAEESRRLAEEANEAEENESRRGRRGSRKGTRRTGRRKRTDNQKVAGKAPAAESPGIDLLAFADMHLSLERSGEQDEPSADSENRTPKAGDEADASAGAGEDSPDDVEIPPRPADSEPAEDEGEALLRSRSLWAKKEAEQAEEAFEAESEGSSAADDGAEADESADASASDGDADDDGDDDDSAIDGDNGETTTINELTADEEAREELERRPRVRLRDYKIQEVINRRQIMLVQVVKEERGNKGAALTTYLSLAGRYCVLMPNTPRGGGISRKITNAADRKRLKAIAAELDVPEGMGLIIRTAGANRTKAEIRRDYEYLLRLWESVRELTLQSSAPCLVYEEGSLIKRSIRDLYSREIDTVQVEGEDGYKEAKAFMRMLMPSHAKNVQSYKDRIPLFQRFQVEQQLDAMLNPQVQLPSGGYLVLNPTEALVAIDVNSGKSTREHNIEDTALRTNLEAAEEVARQLRLRDLAGLIVIDFIDMEEPRNNRAVERKLKECLKQDRARIQTGRISMFGLLEMSRQRLRPGMMEVSTVTCEHCQGTGIVRSVESAALRILRACEEEGLRQRTQDLTVPCAPDVATYLLNVKRHQLTEIEQRYGVTVTIDADITSGRDSFEIKRGQPMTEGRRQVINEQAVRLESAFGLAEEAAPVEAAPAAAPTEESKPKSRRGGRRRRKGETEEAPAETAAADAQDTEKVVADAAAESRKGEESREGAEPRRRRRRGKRGGRRHRKTRSGSQQPEAAARSTSTATDETAADAGNGSGGAEAQTATAEFAPAVPGNGHDIRAVADAQPETAPAEIGGDVPAPLAPAEAPAEPPSPAEETQPMAAEAALSNGNGHGPEAAAKPARPRRARSRARARVVEPADAASEAPESPDADSSPEPAPKSKEPARRGWWQRRL